eukprot:scaffold2202_cov72-Phaeocystis_antarctica.AAC.2
MAAAQLVRHDQRAAVSIGRCSRPPAAASMRFRRAIPAHCPCHVVQPRARPLCTIRRNTLSAMSCTRFSLACSVANASCCSELS